jgi:hypothetical protein
MVPILNITIPKFGNFYSLLNFDRISGLLGASIRGEAAFPRWLIPGDFASLFWTVPLRVFYFIASPLPWDVKSAEHLIGAFDAALYTSLVIVMLVNFKSIRQNRLAFLMFLLFLFLLVGFSLGTGNFGTAVRHRFKLLPLLLILSTPFINRLSWNTKKFKMGM